MHGNLDIECLMGQESEAGQVQNIFYHQVEHNLVVVDQELEEKVVVVVVVVVVKVVKKVEVMEKVGEKMEMGMEKYVVFADLAHIVLLSTDCVHQGLPQARLEKIVGFE